MTSTRIAIILLAFALLSSNLLLLNQQARAEPGASLQDPIIMGCPDKGWPPYHFPKGKDQPLGIMPEIFVEATSTLDYSVELVWLPEKRAMQRLKQGDIDVYTKAKEWVAQPSRYLWSQPVVDSTDVLAFRTGEEWAFNGPTDLDNKVVGTVLGYRYPTLEPLFLSGNATRMDATNTHIQLKMLLSRRTDAAVINQHVAQWLIRETPFLTPQQLRFSKKPLASASYRYVFSTHRDWGDFIQKLDQEMERMRTDGRMDAILDKYR
ncbi:substrate-binding periplasmic protein [Desulfovibrio ferrophilus]|uniref:Solute-binding protein family 3/N-terminal domain-containing protein n=1 Tax=Desulfovibrio ferrophilus TaxID=241368 RepID=A0A2Z6AYD4_9BACT|nr:transporter substrate-binding domain-containing protein [Desulfovibrio ferrophilus]BBD08271.1 uncharacterized protein DFE_1545 [Desulfovibrio ferrophilus]